MAKKSNKSVLSSIIVLVFALLTLSTVLLPILSKSVLALGETVGDATIATGKDVFAVAFCGELGIVEIAKLTDGARLLYSLKIAEDTALLTSIMMYVYIATLAVACLVVVMAILSLLGVKAGGFNKILGIILIVVSLATVVLAFIVSGNATHLEKGAISGKDSGVLTALAYGMYVVVAGTIAGVINLIKTKK
jgi:hypothetical protein